MEDAELQQLETTITTLETEIAGLTQRHRECIDRARDFNAEGRDVLGRRTSLQSALDKARVAARQEREARSIAAKQKANEEAAARAAEAAEKKAAEPAQPDPMELLTQQVAILTAKIEELSAK